MNCLCVPFSFLLSRQRYGFSHFSTGDLLRDEVNSGSERGKRLNEIMQSGQLVPLTEVLGLLKDAIAKNASSNGYLIDGYPRELEQAVCFEKDVGKCTVVIYFEASDDTMTKRLLERGKTSGRADDNEATIKKRLTTFHGNNQPILDAYKDRVVRISAERPVEEVFSDVCKCIDGTCKC